MVWGAPTSRSSGGRSAVQAIRGTPARSASTTAAWSSAAAVPLVVTTSGRTPGGQPDPEGGEPGRPLVEPDMDGDIRVGGQGQGQRRRPRARAHHGVGHPAAHPLVDQGGGERRLARPDGRCRRQASVRSSAAPHDHRTPILEPPPSAVAALHADTTGNGTDVW